MNGVNRPAFFLGYAQVAFGQVLAQLGQLLSEFFIEQAL